MGELRYIANSTRPDITFIVNRLAAATHNRTKRHWLHLKRLMRYLAGTRNDGIMCKPGQQRDALICFVNDPSMSRRTHPIQTFLDADFAGDESDRNSTSGVIHLFNSGPIAWTKTDVNKAIDASAINMRGGIHCRHYSSPNNALAVAFTQ